MGKRDNIIEIKGIVRNTKDSATRDGECDELVGMRMKDGSWRPVGQLRVLEGSNGLVGGLKRVWVHRNRYAHVLAINAAGKLCWAGEMDADNKVVAYSSEVVIDDSIITSVGEVVLTQTGHLIAVKSAEYGMRYYLYRTESNRYDSVAVDFNSVRDYGLLPYGSIDFKVERVEDENGRAVWFSSDIQSAGIAGAYNSGIAEEGRVMRTVVDKTNGLVKKLGYFTGGFMVCTAAELYDGTYILMSKPTLLCPPNYKSRGAMGGWNTELRANPAAAGVSDGYGNNVWTGANGVCDKVVCKQGATMPTTVLNDVRMGKMNILPWLYSSRAGSGVWGTFNNYAVAARQGMRKYDYESERIGSGENFSAYSMDIWSMLNDTDVNSNYSWGNVASAPRLMVKNLKPLCQMYCYGDIKDDTTVCYTNANKLLYKINNLLNKEYRDVIRRIVVFATREVDMFDYFNNPQSDCYYEYGATSNDKRTINGYQWNYRDSEKVKKELMNEPLMYKIGEIGVDLAEADKGKWVELEIEEGVLENLVSQERLKVDSVGRNQFKPRVAFPYNGRLHLANYDERLFEGWLLNDMFHWGGSGQYGFSRRGLLQWANGGDGYIKVTLEDSEARRVVVRRIELEKVDGGIQMSVLNPSRSVKKKLKAAYVQSLNCLLSYPDKRAKEIEIYLRDRAAGMAVSANNVFHLKVSLEAHDWYNLAYYINEDFKPIDIDYTERFTGTISVPEEENVMETRANQMKVSRTDNPLFFPNENTYLIGNGEIVGLAANAETLMGGQIGDAPLYVMCSDGVWGMFVDSSGQFTYSNSRIISRYVCNNAQGIQAIMGGVVMPTEWGLVLLSGLDSKDVSDIVEGEPLDISERLPKAWLCIDHERLVELQSYVEGEFVEFLQSAIIGYNYYEKELWVMGGGWSYVLGEAGHWTKRKETGVQLVNDFPNLYLLTEGGKLMDLQREDKRDATECMMLTRMVKAQTQEFKQTERMIVRGEFKLGEHHEIPEIVDLTQTSAKALFEKCWVENPEIETLTEKGAPRSIEGKVLVEKRIGVVNTDGIVPLQREGSQYVPNWSNVQSMSESLSAKAYMYDGTFKRKEWTDVPTMDDGYYPQFRFDDEGDVCVKFKAGVPYLDTQIAKPSGVGTDFTNLIYFPEGFEGKFEEVYNILNTEGDDERMKYQRSTETSQHGLYVYSQGDNTTAVTYQDTIDSLAADKNYEVYNTDVVGTTKVTKVYTKYNGVARSNANCHDVVTQMSNGTNSWSAAKKNNSVELTAGNYVSNDGLQFSVTAAQAGSYKYYQIEANVANGTFGRTVPQLNLYTLENGKYYRLGANGDVFEFSGGGSYTWSKLQAKVANGDFELIEVASGSDTVALVNGRYYWFKLKGVVASESIDVKVRFIGSTGTYTITAIENGLAGTGMFVVVSTETVDVSSVRSLTLERAIYRFVYMVNGVEVEKVVSTKTIVSDTDLTKTLISWIAWAIAASEYEGGECPKCGLYLYGSYDGYKWALVGARERDGEFRDIGLVAHRVDCKYFRLMLCGKLLSGSSVEYVEQMVEEKLYDNGKIR